MKGCNLPISRNEKFYILYPSYVLAKSHILPFVTSISEYHFPLELVHIDLWRPSPVKSHNGYSYFVSFINEFTKYIWLYLLKTKAEVYQTFLHFKTLVENQLNTKMKVVQSDWGREYRSLSRYLHENEILHRVSCPYTPQQNGTAERKHMHIVEMGLSLLAQSHLPLKHWDDAFVTSVYLINRIPARTIHYKTPLELMYGYPPDYKKLKVFGCLCYPFLRPYNKHKLEFRSVAENFLGYNNQYRGYKVLLPNGKNHSD